MKPVWTVWPLAALLATALAAGGRCADTPDDLKQTILKFNSITGTELISKKVSELIKDSKGTEKVLAKAEEMFKENPKQFQYNGAAILARTAAVLRKHDLSLQFYKHCITLAQNVKSSSKLSESYGGQILVLNDAKRYGEVEKVARAFLELNLDDALDDEKPFITEHLALAMAKQGKIADAIKLTDGLIKEHDGWYFLRLKGLVLVEAGKHEDAVKVFNDAIDKIKKADLLKEETKEAFTERLRAILSTVYVDMNQVEKAAEQLQILLKKKPDHPTYNNDLGYIWADHDMNLDEAEKYIRKALDEDRKQRKKDPDLTPEEDKDKSAFLDSLGWVLYKKKQYAEAKKPLLEAIKDEDGQHLEIFDHLADVHMALGEKAEAIAVWKKALELDISSKRDIKRQQEVLKKLKAAEGK